MHARRTMAPPWARLVVLLRRARRWLHCLCVCALTPTCSLAPGQPVQIESTRFVRAAVCFFALLLQPVTSKFTQFGHAPMFQARSTLVSHHNVMTSDTRTHIRPREQAQMHIPASARRVGYLRNKEVLSLRCLPHSCCTLRAGAAADRVDLLTLWPAWPLRCIVFARARPEGIPCARASTGREWHGHRCFQPRSACAIAAAGSIVVPLICGARGGPASERTLQRPQLHGTRRVR